METNNLAEMYDAPPMSWEEVTARLDRGFNQGPGSQEGEPGRYTTWVSTINADGGPHMNAVGAVWFDGAFYLVTGPRTRRGRNLARDPRCALSLSVREFDLVVEGLVVRVLGDELERVAKHYHDDEGWPAEVDDSGGCGHRPVQRPERGPGAVACLPDRADLRSRRRDRGAVWRDPLEVLR